MAAAFLILIFMSYITLGLPDSATGTAWPYMRAELGVNLSAAGLFTMIIALCSALSASLMPRVTKKTGTGTLLAVCSTVTGASILAISFLNNYYVILAFAVPLGIAGGGVDVSINNYVSERYTSKIMNWVHASWGLGAMIGPLLITLALSLDGGSWRTGYQILGGIQLAFAVVLFCTLPMWKKDYAKKIIVNSENFSTSHNASNKRIAILLAALSFFFYCGVEMSVGNWLNSLLVDLRGLDHTKSGVCVSLYFGAIMAGRIIMGIFSNKLGNRKSVTFGLCVAFIGAGLFFIPNLIATYISVALIGLGLAPIYPCLMHETIHRFAPETSRKVIGYQVAAATVGILSIPPLTGLILQNKGLNLLPAIVIVLLGILFIIIAALNAVTKNKLKPPSDNDKNNLEDVSTFGLPADGEPVNNSDKAET